MRPGSPDPVSHVPGLTPPFLLFFAHQKLFLDGALVPRLRSTKTPCFLSTLIGWYRIAFLGRLSTPRPAWGSAGEPSVRTSRLDKCRGGIFPDFPGGIFLSLIHI